MIHFLKSSSNCEKRAWNFLLNTLLWREKSKQSSLSLVFLTQSCVLGCLTQLRKLASINIILYDEWVENEKLWNKSPLSRLIRELLFIIIDVKCRQEKEKKYWRCAKVKFKIYQWKNWIKRKWKWKNTNWQKSMKQVNPVKVFFWLSFTEA